jgi:imidazole glycerol-phosphate synthase subunit HisH
MITIVDYGMGNLRSVTNALRLLGAESRISSKPQDVASADKLILPGVGAFGAAMRELESRGLAGPVRAYAESGKPFLGICLGLQLLFEWSEEGGRVNGLGLLKGAVRRFPDSPERKVPHMGWNQVKRTRSAPAKLTDGIGDGSYFYFVHSYYAEPQDRSIVQLETDYGVAFPAVIQAGSIAATQFHPEKSQAAGLALLGRFAAS